MDNNSEKVEMLPLKSDNHKSHKGQNHVCGHRIPHIYHFEVNHECLQLIECAEMRIELGSLLLERPLTW